MPLHQFVILTHCRVFSVSEDDCWAAVQLLASHWTQRLELHSLTAFISTEAALERCLWMTCELLWCCTFAGFKTCLVDRSISSQTSPSVRENILSVNKNTKCFPTVYITAVLFLFLESSCIFRTIVSKWNIHCMLRLSFCPTPLLISIL